MNYKKYNIEHHYFELDKDEEVEIFIGERIIVRYQLGDCIAFLENKKAINFLNRIMKDKKDNTFFCTTVDSLLTECTLRD